MSCWFLSVVCKLHIWQYRQYCCTAITCVIHNSLTACSSAYQTWQHKDYMYTAYCFFYGAYNGQAVPATQLAVSLKILMKITPQPLSSAHAAAAPATAPVAQYVHIVKHTPKDHIPGFGRERQSPKDCRVNTPPTPTFTTVGYSPLIMPEFLK